MRYPIFAATRAHRLWALTVLFCGIGISVSAPATAAEPPGWTSAVTKYLQTCARADGGYAWEDQADSHITPTFAVIGTYHALGIEPPDRAKLADFVRTHHPFKKKRPERELHEFEFQQMQALRWLGADVKSFEPTVRTWTTAPPYPSRYEKHSYPVFQQEVTAFVCRELADMPVTDLSPKFIEYVNLRRRANGSFNNTPANDGSDGNVINTLWGLRTLHTLQRVDEKKPETVQWLRSCQQSDGGFFHQPKPEYGRAEDVVYAWAAVQALKMIGGEPGNRDGAVRFIQSLYNADGGFGDRPGWPSNPLATYYALETLAALNATGGFSAAGNAIAPSTPLPADLKVYTIQIEAPGKGSPQEAVEMARALGIRFWCAKNADKGWVAACQKLADERKVPVKFAIGNEEYGTFMQIPGFGTYSHMVDLFVPAGVDFGPNLTGKTDWTWDQFREKRIAPLEGAAGRLFWQFGENEPLVRMLLDDSIERGQGFAAISTFHFGNPDFINSQPFLYHYRHKIPLVGLQDSHASETWWWDQLTGYRTVYLAKEDRWDGWLSALKNNWVAAIRHDSVTEDKTRMHGGAPGVQEFVKAHATEWQWWDSTALGHPPVSLVAVTPRDEFEVGKPAQGVAIRVRCQWESTVQGLPKDAVTELKSLTVDGQTVQPRKIEKKGDKKAITDIHYLHEIPSPTAGKHTATVVVRNVKSGTESQKSIEFSTP